MNIEKIKIEYAIDQLMEVDITLSAKRQTLLELLKDNNVDNLDNIENVVISRINGKISGINLAREEIRRKILNLRELLNNVEPVLPNNDIIQSFKDKYKDLNQENLDWLIWILNPDQYEKVESKYNKDDILYKKDDKIYMLQNLKDDNWYIDYDLIYLVFEFKFGDNYQLFKYLTKGILKEVYKCKVVTTYLRFF